MIDERHDDGYQHAHALIEQDQTDWMGDGVLWQLVTLELFDEFGVLAPAVCRLSAGEARGLAFALLELAEQAQRLTRGEPPR